MKNLRPPRYSPPRSEFERRLVKWILPHVVGNESIRISFGDGDVTGVSERKGIGEIAAPRLTSLLAILLFPDFHTGESYRKGHWYLIRGDLHNVIEALFEDQNRLFFRYFRFRSRFRGVGYLLSQKVFTRYFTRRVRRHYDEDPEIYQTFLDPELVYTCGFFDDPSDTLERAQERKFDTILRRLRLPDGPTHILEVGSGWGSFSRHLVRRVADARYTGLTISQRQIEWARVTDSIRLTPKQCDRIEYRHEDYLDHVNHPASGYDGIVVIGMMEHVGESHFARFVNTLCRLLKSGRRAAIHSIVSKTSGEPTNSWIDKRIFHGGYAPSIAEVVRAVESCSCRVESVHAHEPENYRRTIECWISNFTQNFDEYRRTHLQYWGADQVSELFRTWYFYFSAVRNMFVPGIMEFQIAHFVIKRP